MSSKQVTSVSVKLEEKINKLEVENSNLRVKSENQGKIDALTDRVNSFK